MTTGGMRMNPRWWKVTYENLEWKAGRRPFWRNSTTVSAHSRKAAIEEVRGRFPPPRYGNYRASAIRE